MLNSAIFSLDRVLTGVALPFTREQGTLLSFLFHGLFLSGDEINGGSADPQQGITVAMFRELLLHFRQQSYRFIAPENLLEDLPVNGKYALITFDDGYYNNARALPVLEELSIPAVFFISTHHVKFEKSFWWDVVFREFYKRGKSRAEISHAVAGYKRLPTSEVEARLRADFGPQALQPVGDLDRPFSQGELKIFAAHPLVRLGNHTCDHAILSNYSATEAVRQIEGAQEDIAGLTGKIPLMIAYPNGNYSSPIIDAARQAGLCLGATIEPGRNKLPFRSGDSELMRIRRFVPRGNQNIDSQCRMFRSSVSLYRAAAGIRRRAIGASYE
jgi:peptidoglycan/xylan/chitin deacetylase (PgdA/CDA1 family)